MFDINELEKQAKAEVAEELGKAAKAKIKASLHTIAMAKKALANAEAEHQALLRDIGST